MKGIVFTEFLEMVEASFGFMMAERIVSESELGSGGIYTAVGTYPHSEMVSLVGKLSEHTQQPVPALLKAFGVHLFPRFVAGYGSLFEGVTDSFSFLIGLDRYIHVEVKKLYPDAELPSFSNHQPDQDTLVMEYQSARRMADFAEGLLEGCVTHFAESISIQREDRLPDGSHSIFTLTRQSNG